MMAHIFEKPLPANPSLIESLSACNQVNNNINQVESSSSFTEIFGELHFHDGTKPPLLDPPPTKLGSDPLQLCTEGLGFESTGDVDEDLMKEYSCDEYWSGCRNGAGERRSPDRYSRRSRGGKGGGFPPLISTIGRSGKPLVHLESYRNDGRFILREVRMPTHDFLHASREDGRLKLHLFHPAVELLGGGGEEDV